MEYKQIYNRSNGEPKIIEMNEDGEYNFDMFIYTDVAPPSELYGVIYFDGDKWIGSSKEEWLENLPESDPHIPSVNEIMLAQAQMQVTKTANQLIKTQQEQADTLTELTKKEQRLKEIEQQQANTLLEIAKLKGEK